MSEVKFTKGPWFTSYLKRKDGMYSQAVYDSNKEYICECNWYPVEGVLREIDGKTYRSTTTNRESNAYLIAVSPEMYEEIERDVNNLLELLSNLKRYSNDHLFYESELKRKQLLLAKARGESQ